jgi:hypothetical protein
MDRHRAGSSKSCAQACVAGERHSTQKRSWIVEHEEIRCSEGIAVEAILLEEGAGCIVVIVEKVVHKTKQLDAFCHLVRAVQIDDRESRHLGVQVAVVVDEPLGADKVYVDAELPGIGDGVLDTSLEALGRNARNVVTGRNENVAAGVRKRIVRRRYEKGTSVDRVDVGVVKGKKRSDVCFSLAG